MMPVSVTIDWYGAFKKDVAALQGERWGPHDKLLYMALAPYNVVRYIGRTRADRLRGRMRSHDQRGQIESDDDLYIGRVSTSGIPGPKPKDVPPDLDAAEHALIFVLKPERNTDFKEKAPDDCVVVYSRTFDPQQEPIMPPKFPALVVYDPSLTGSILFTRGQLPFPDVT